MQPLQEQGDRCLLVPQRRFDPKYAHGDFNQQASRVDTKMKACQAVFTVWYFVTWPSIKFALTAGNLCRAYYRNGRSCRMNVAGQKATITNCDNDSLVAEQLYWQFARDGMVALEGRMSWDTTIVQRETTLRLSHDNVTTPLQWTAY